MPFSIRQLETSESAEGRHQLLGGGGIHREAGLGVPQVVAGAAGELAHGGFRAIEGSCHSGVVLVERKQPKNEEAAEPLVRIVVL